MHQERTVNIKGLSLGLHLDVRMISWICIATELDPYSLHGMAVVHVMHTSCITDSSGWDVENEVCWDTQ